MLSSLLALIERLSLFTTAAAAAAGLSLSLLGRANRKMVGKTADQMCTMSAAMCCSHVPLFTMQHWILLKLQCI